MKGVGEYWHAKWLILPPTKAETCKATPNDAATKVLYVLSDGLEVRPLVLCCTLPSFARSPDLLH